MATHSDGDDGFLTRWSRRKLAAKDAEAAAPDAPSLDDGDAAAPGQDAAQASLAAAGQAAEGAELTEEDVARLGPESDYTAFLKAGVSESVRRLALRKLWLSDPVLANLDGLIDYGEEVLAHAGPAVNVASSWKLGRGFQSAQEKPAEASDQAAQAEDGGDGPPAGEEPEAEPGATGAAAPDSEEAGDGPERA